MSPRHPRSIRPSSIKLAKKLCDFGHMHPAEREQAYRDAAITIDEYVNRCLWVKRGRQRKEEEEKT